MQSYVLKLRVGETRPFNTLADLFVYESATATPAAGDTRIRVKPDTGAEMVLRPGQRFRMSPGESAQHWEVSALDPSVVLDGAVIIGSGEFDDANTLNKVTLDATLANNVTVMNAPHVVVDSLPNVTLAGTPHVVVDSLPNVTLAGTPNVAVTSMPNVTLAGTPNVAVTNTPNVAVTNTPNVTVANTPANRVPVTLDLTQTPNVAVTNTPNVKVTNSVAERVPVTLDLAQQIKVDTSTPLNVTGPIVQYTGSFADATVAVPSAIQIFSAAQNPNGAYIEFAQVVAFNTASVGLIEIIAKATAPTSNIDGDVLMIVGVTSSSDADPTTLNQRIKVPANKGAWIFQSGSAAFNTAQKTVLYTLL